MKLDVCNDMTSSVCIHYIKVIVFGFFFQCEIAFNNDRNLTYSVVYKPTMEGMYRVVVKFAGREIPKSPFDVHVEGTVGDASKVTAAGPGIERTGVTVNQRTYFEVYTKGRKLQLVHYGPHQFIKTL